MSHTHDDLVAMASTHLSGTRKCTIVLTEAGGGFEIPDVIGWGPTGSILIECKASRSDFLSDRKKPSRSGPGMGRERYYLTPRGIIGGLELPTGWGLLEARGSRVFRIVRHLGRHDYNIHAERRLIFAELSDWHRAIRLCFHGPTRSWEDKLEVGRLAQLKRRADGLEFKAKVIR